jgi:hypothetical protein
MNALKHGRRSRQLAELGGLVAQSPRMRQVLLDVAARWDKESAKADYVASRILFTLLARTLEQSPHGLSVRSPDADRRSITQNLAKEGLLEQPGADLFTISGPDNQTPTETPENDQTPDTNPID